MVSRTASCRVPSPPLPFERALRQVNGPELMAQKSGDAEGALRKVFERAAAGAPCAPIPRGFR